MVVAPCAWLVRLSHLQHLQHLLHLPRLPRLLRLLRLLRFVHLPRSAPVLATLALSACATLTPPRPDATTLDGRLAVQVDATAGDAARSFSAPFSLHGDEREGGLDLSSPLGTRLAQARWQPTQATLTTAEGEERRYPTLDAMAQDLLGQTVPMAALLSWLRGTPWRGAPSAAVAGRGFDQLGWQVDTSRHGEGLVVAQHPGPPRVTVRARLDPKGGS
jgi:outer membrane lipoprotein LolB